eukprot:CAMPEP_0181130088 /NCGR_PEP_ID=MMETSP1071-20121207/29669_1 /TAXON_ID=35127 /ORGANISM="Thalassiosira sp., Strain NH16" /LENGTH=268 /DNA_ID=CAMNT_0023216119 /DNA_START=34 /DNA_END=837 /DNA_ORIENTATION=+
MKSSIASIVLAMAAPTAAFRSAPSASRPSTSLDSLRDIASFSDDMKMMGGEYEAFDRNGAFSRSPRGGAGGRPDMMYGGGGQGMGQGMGPPGQGMGQAMGPPGQGMGPPGQPDPFARRGGGGEDRMHTRDGFDPYSAYGSSFGTSRSDGRRGGGMDYYGPDMMMGGGGMMMGRGGEMMNGVRNDNTMGGFSYSSRVTDYGQGGPGGGPQDYGRGGGPQDYDMGGFFDEGPPMGFGGMEYDQQGWSTSSRGADTPVPMGADMVGSMVMW